MYIYKCKVYSTESHPPTNPTTHPPTHEECDGVAAAQFSVNFYFIHLFIYLILAGQGTCECDGVAAA